MSTYPSINKALKTADLYPFSRSPFYYVRTPSERLRGSLWSIAVQIWPLAAPPLHLFLRKTAAVEVVQMGI